MSLEGISIRRVEGKDLEQVKRIADSRLREDYSIDLLKFFFESHPQCFFVAEESSTIIGYVLGVPLDQRTLRILMLAVRKDMTMKGLGSSLIDLCIDHAQQRMMTSIVLEVGTENNIAVEFYTRRGFKVTGRIQKYYKDKSDAFIMKRYLPM